MPPKVEVGKIKLGSLEGKTVFVAGASSKSTTYNCYKFLDVFLDRLKITHFGLAFFMNANLFFFIKVYLGSTGGAKLLPCKYS